MRCSGEQTAPIPAPEPRSWQCPPSSCLFPPCQGSWPREQPEGSRLLQHFPAKFSFLLKGSASNIIVSPRSTSEDGFDTFQPLLFYQPKTHQPEAPAATSGPRAHVPSCPSHCQTSAVISCPVPPVSSSQSKRGFFWVCLPLLPSLMQESLTTFNLG